MVNECCTNELCINRETQLRLARLREELLTNFNSLLIDRIRFLEQTINRFSLISSSTTSQPSAVAITEKFLPPEIIITDRLTVPPTLRRSTSAAAAYLLQQPDDLKVLADVASVRSYPSDVDLSSKKEQEKWFLSIKTPLHTQNRTRFACTKDYLSTPMIHRQWTCSTNDIPSSTTSVNEKGRLESRRFACDVDDNDVRAFKAMVYMEQARKQNTRPLTRLRQALGISSTTSTGNISAYNSKK